MSKKKKLLRFRENESFPNVIQPPLSDFFDKGVGKVRKHRLAGNWRKDIFKNDNPIVLELGCGKGEYSVGLGKMHPDVNYIGVDIKGARIWFGAKEALDYNLKNVAFLRIRIDFIDAFFGENEIDQVWITFPDPKEKEEWEEKRLTSKTFVGRYKKFLKEEGVIHLKTDSAFLHKNTLEVIKVNGYNLLMADADIYKSDLDNFSPELKQVLSLKTYYEEMFSKKGHLITYLKFRP
ncbi:MAG: tRNA (guanosine(46)-N7)-methyltransferase TrmB [Crocinitomicaceae bacterium]|nr:tRNA (guanosine(46)-N7)-methyltransferase TrmB [Crocinitomicaceae bacterium]|tara:strand:- start:7949 stop:8653 length:705 start_codon:yes stop_codon:yes gene_type:complete